MLVLAAGGRGEEEEEEEKCAELPLAPLPKCSGSSSPMKLEPGAEAAAALPEKLRAAAEEERKEEEEEEEEESSAAREACACACRGSCSAGRAELVRWPLSLAQPAAALMSWASGLPTPPRA
jgi:hypothetical protein